MRNLVPLTHKEMMQEVTENCGSVEDYKLIDGLYYLKDDLFHCSNSHCDFVTNDRYELKELNCGFLFCADCINSD